MKLLLTIDAINKGGAERILTRLANHLSLNNEIILCQMLDEMHNYPLSNNVKTFFLGSVELSKKEYKALRFFASILATLLMVLTFIKKKERKSASKFLFDFMSAIVRYKKLVQELKPDVVVSFLINSNLIGLLAKKIFGLNMPLVTGARNRIANEISSLRFSILYEFILKKIYLYSDKYIAVTGDEAAEAVSEFNIPKENVALVNNGIDIEYVKGKALLPPPINQKRINNNSFNIVLVGRLTYVKNQRLLVQAISKLNMKKEINLFLLGEGEDFNRLKKLSLDLGVKDKVVFLGWQKNPYPYIKQCDLLVLTSFWEGFPNVLLEGMALGLPVISTTSSKAVEMIIDHKKCGFLIDNDLDSLVNAIEILVNDQELCKQMSLHSQEKVKEFSLDTMLNEFKEILQEVYLNKRP
nr:glycosyltransferase [uncultured Desulfobacter sp.]